MVDCHYPITFQAASHNSGPNRVITTILPVADRSSATSSERCTEH